MLNKSIFAFLTVIVGIQSCNQKKSILLEKIDIQSCMDTKQKKTIKKKGKNSLQQNINKKQIEVDDYIEFSKKYPLCSLVSGENLQAITDGKKAAVTLCTTPLPNSKFHHASLVFEFFDQYSQEIRILNVHFGGDGQSEYIKGKPNIDNREETIAKIFGSIEKDEFQEEAIPKFRLPTYFRKYTFIVDKKKAMKALAQVSKDENLEYKTNRSPYWNSAFTKDLKKIKSYNCCTYVARILYFMDIETNFLNRFWPPKNVYFLLIYIKEKAISESKSYLIEKNFPQEYKEITTYRDKLFEKAIDLAKREKYEESLNYIQECAHKGHGASQYFLGWLDNNKSNKEPENFIKEVIPTETEEVKKLEDLQNIFKERPICNITKKKIYDIAYEDKIEEKLEITKDQNIYFRLSKKNEFCKLQRSQEEKFHQVD